MRNNSQELELTRPLGLLVLFIVVVASLLLIFSRFDQSRKDRIYREYAGETESYIIRNRAGLISLFNFFSTRPASCLSEIANRPVQLVPIPQDEQSCSQTLFRSQINNLVSSDLRDWSSTAFLIKDKEIVKVIRLSGDMREFSGYLPEKESLVKKLLDGEVSSLPWDEYTYEFPGKEVIFSVKDDNGKIIGAIVRSVIEQSNF